MTTETNEILNFNASHIISVELKADVASNCKLRSSFVHEKLLETKNNLSGNPLLLKLSNKGLKFLNPDSQVLIMSHSIHRISYTACDRSSCQFAMVARSAGDSGGSSQFCHIVRLGSVEEADTINRYIGSLFKDLNHKRKTRKSENLPKSGETPSKTMPEEYSSEPKESLVQSRCSNNLYDDLDTRLKRISTPHIEELVSEKHYVRRLSLCIPSPNSEDQTINQGPINLHSSLEKKSNNANSTNQVPENNRPLLRKKSDHKSNKISAVIERLSFRASRDLSADLLKSGSPVVALKEQLESYDRLTDKVVSHPPESSLNSFPANVNSIFNSLTPKKRFPVPHQNDSTNCLKMSALSRKNSAPIPLEQVVNSFQNMTEEQPPVPPVRIHSLRNPVPSRPSALIDESPLVRCKRDTSSQPVSVQLIDQDDHLSSITTPSSCGDTHGDSYIDETRPTCADVSNSNSSNNNNQTSKQRVPATQNKINFSASFNDSQYRSFNNNNFSYDNQNSVISSNYFKNLSKDDTTDYLLNKELGAFILRNSASHPGCYALSVKVSDVSVSHYIIQSLSVGFQIKGLDKTWPSLHSLITHLSVIPEMLPCLLQIPHQIVTASQDQSDLIPVNYGLSAANRRLQSLPQSKSSVEEYHHRMRQFLNDSSVQAGQEQYQQLSDFSSMVASLELN